MYYTEHKPENKNRGGLETRLGFSYLITSDRTIHTGSGGLIAHDIDTCICIVILVHAEFHPVQQLVVFPGNPLQGRRQLLRSGGGA